MLNTLKTVSAIAITGGVVALAAFPASAASVNKSYSYFSIGGATLDEIQEELGRRGPRVKSTGARHPGATRMEFKSRVKYTQTNRGCRISGANVWVDAKVILPRWRSPKRADQDVRFIWATLAADIKRHEESHVVIAKNHARMLEQGLLRLGSQKNCDLAAEKAKAVSNKVLARHDAEQARFDRVETMNFEKRLLSLLKYRFQQSQTKRGSGS